MSALALALGLTLLAGLATALGGLVAVHRSVRGGDGLALALAFAAGAMVLVSLVEIVPKGARDLAPALGHRGAWTATIGLALVGAACVALLGRLLPGDAGAHPDAARRLARRNGLVVALAVTAHNLPEGLATFVATLDDPGAGVTLAVAIALHNVPEGIAVAAPLYGSGAGRGPALVAATLSGLAEPVGAVVGYVVLASLLPAAAYGLVFGLVAGVMLALGLTELLPGACRLVPLRPALTAAAAGGATMVASVALLGVA